MGVRLPRKTSAPAWLKKAVVLFLVLVSFIILDYACYRNRINYGVSLFGVPLGGLDKLQAERKIAEIWDETWRGGGEILFYGNDQSWVISGMDLGVSLALEETLEAAYHIGRERCFVLSYPKRISLLVSPVKAVPQFTVNHNKFEKALEPITLKLQKDPVDAFFELDKERKYVRVVPESHGSKVDLEATLQSLYRYLENLPEEGSVVVFTSTVPAEITKSDLEELGVSEELATAATVIGDSYPNRKHNIALAASRVDGHLLLPGQVFSFNGVVGETTLEKGYKKAPVIVNRQLVDGVGGGICQVSSTLYNAALLAGLEILERANHSLPVGYLSPGLDATVAYGWLDLKFANDTGRAIWIRTFLDNNELTVSLYGSPVPGREIRVFTSDLVTIAPETKMTQTPDLPSGETVKVSGGQPGYRVNVWRAFYQNGKELRKEKVSSDYYHPIPAEYHVGITPDSGEEKGQEIPQE